MKRFPFFRIALSAAPATSGGGRVQSVVVGLEPVPFARAEFSGSGVMARLICPAVLCCHYRSGAMNHDLLLAFALSTDGRTQVVALQIKNYGWEPQWSGWHGSWQFMGSAFHIWINFRGDERRLVAKRVLLAVAHGSVGGAGSPQPTAFAFCGFMADRHADVHVSFSIQTFLFLEKQLEYNEWFFVQEPSVEKLS